VVNEEEEHEEENDDSDSEHSEEHNQLGEFEGFTVGGEEHGETHDRVLPTLERPRLIPFRRRRLSTYESNDGGMDLESDKIGGSARSL